VILAIDTSALLSIFKGEESGPAWIQLLAKLSAESAVVATDVVWAELAPLFPHHAALHRRMEDLGIAYDPILEKTAFLAGLSFQSYRRQGGPRQHLIPDFLIAAHAQHQTDGLIAADRGYIRRYFHSLRLHTL
jgi:predicted nucleic acid-binding protein